MAAKSVITPKRTLISHFTLPGAGSARRAGTAGVVKRWGGCVETEDGGGSIERSAPASTTWRGDIASFLLMNCHSSAGTRVAEIPAAGLRGVHRADRTPRVRMTWRYHVTNSI